MIAKKGFTLIELLVVVGILAVLATATTLILNPAELLRQSRDSTRIADLASLSNAIDLYLADQESPALGTASFCTNGAVTKSKKATPTACTQNQIRLVNGTGWVGVNFGAMTNGSPVPRLPLDPVSGTSTTASTNCGAGLDACFYQYIPDDTNKDYELNASMESIKFSNNGVSDVELVDGGDNDQAYEIGSNLFL